jgi:arginyl-tRNA--protein-N-Asp/Glu arginylyltransferase
MAYLSWDTQTINDFSASVVSEMYGKGYVFTRKSKGLMNQTRSLRISLSNFELQSENRRVLRKTEDLALTTQSLPLAISSYSWEIHKLGKDYYTKKFGDGVFTAAKIKELVTDWTKSNYNLLLNFSAGEAKSNVGYCIAYQNNEILHYAYPFYDLDKYQNNYGMGMMLQAILYAQRAAKKYFYLGSATRPADNYKLQFKGLEWFDGQQWSTDIDQVKQLISLKQE